MNEEKIFCVFEFHWNKMKLDESNPFIQAIKYMAYEFFKKGVKLGVGHEVDPIKPIQPTQPIRPIITTETTFDTFWQLYDKRVGKQKCISLWGRLTLAEQAACIAYIPLYKQAQPSKQYRKNPETFLRNKSWNDELIYSNNEQQQPTIEQRRAAKLADIITG